MAAPTRYAVIDDLRGGMNGVDDPFTLPANECLYAKNIDWYRSSVGHKRHGSSALSMTGGTFTGAISTLIRHVPGADETAQELWGIDSAATPIVNRLAGGSSWAAVTLKDNITGNAWDVHGATVDGKLFLAYKSAVNRLHYWDGSTVKRAGINPGTTAPTVANTGAGAYAAVLRYYRVRFYTGSGAIVSEATPSVSFTPSGAGTAARVTQPTPPNEGETNWAVEASTDNVTFYQIGLVAIATTTFDDTFATTTYSTNFYVSPSTGTFTLQKPYKFIAGADNRLLGFGSHNSSDPQSRVEFSDIVGGVTLGISGLASDDAAERVNTTGGYYLDLDESDSGVPSGLIGPVNGNYYAFKTNQMWELRPTGEVSAPFAATCISKTIGAIGQRAINRGEDAQGRPCVYFMSQIGPYRYGANGLEYLGRKIDHIFNNTSANPFAGGAKLTSGQAVTLYYHAKKQVWWWFTVGSVADITNTLYIYDVVHGGWANWSGIEATCAATLFADSIGATMGRRLVPYMATTGVETVWRLDDETATDDAGTNIAEAVIITRPLEFGPATLGSLSEVEVVVTRSTSGGSLTLYAIPDFNNVSQAQATSTLTTSSIPVWHRIPLAVADAHTVCLQVGDGDTDVTWSLERITAALHPQEACLA